MGRKVGERKPNGVSGAQMALYACFALYLVNIYLSRTIYIIDFPSFVAGDAVVPFGTIRTLVGMVLTVVALCIYKTLDRLIRMRATLMGAAIANLVGMALVLYSSYGLAARDFVGAPLVAMVGYAMMSASGTILALVVAQLFVCNHGEVKRVVIAFFAAMVLSSIAALIGFFAHVLILVVLPFVVWWLCGLVSLPRGESVQREPEISREDVSFVSLAIGYLSFVFAFSLSTSFSRWQYLSGGSSDNLVRCVTMLLMTALVGVVIYVTKRSYLKFNSIALYRATFLFFIVSLCMMLFAPTATELAQSTQFVSDLILRTLIFVTVYRICQRYGMSVTVVLCSGALVRHCASILFNFAEGTSPLFNIMAMVGIIILLLAVVYTVVFTERNLETLTERRKPRAEAFILESKLEALGERYGLTKREMDVAKLLSQGRTVAFIADELFVSPRTVSTHVTNIYGKMDVHTRQDFLDIFQETRSAASRSVTSSRDA